MRMVVFLDFCRVVWVKYYEEKSQLLEVRCFRLVLAVAVAVAVAQVVLANSRFTQSSARGYKTLGYASPHVVLQRVQRSRFYNLCGYHDYSSQEVVPEFSHGRPQLVN